MKIILIVGLVILLLNNLFGEVRNGYEKDIAGFRQSLESLKEMLQTDQSLRASERRRMKENIKLLVNLIVYHEITDSLLKQFKIISPHLYNTMDTLKDCNGRPIDIYVKFIPKDELRFQAAGAAYFTQSASDPDRCTSRQGEGSILVEVWIFNKALVVLAHEFGHLYYVVPNLRSYVGFYQREYDGAPADVMLGHRSNDPSGKLATVFEVAFRKSYATYLKGDVTPRMTPLALINPLKRNVLEQTSN
jgi:hypothetical protein